MDTIKEWSSCDDYVKLFTINAVLWVRVQYSNNTCAFISTTDQVVMASEVSHSLYLLLKDGSYKLLFGFHVL